MIKLYSAVWKVPAADVSFKKTFLFELTKSEHSWLEFKFSGNSTTSSNATTPVIAPSNETASNITPSNATLSNVAPLNATSSIAAPVNSTADEGSKIQKDEKLQSISVKAEKSFSIRKRRSLEDEDESDGVKKMAARGDRSEMPLIKRNANEGKCHLSQACNFLFSIFTFKFKTWLL